MDAFKGFYCEIDASNDFEAIKAEIKRILKITLTPKYAKRPPRILVLGPPNSGKTTIAELLAKRYRLVFVSAGNLLEEEIKAKTTRGQVATEQLGKGEQVSDKIMGKIVEERLNQPDCKVNGWVLEGFPANEAQVKILRQGRHVVSLAVELEVEDEVAVERSDSKRVDPVTGKVYSLINEYLQPSPEIAARLVAKESDSQEAVKTRLKNWKDFRGDLVEGYKGKTIIVSTEKPIQAILEVISESIES